MSNASGQVSGHETASAVITAFSPAILLTTFLFLWRASYRPTDSDWAALFLAPLAFGMFIGFRTPLAMMLLARSRSVVQRDSWVSPFVSGKIRATLLSLVFVAITLPIIAWEALEANGITAVALSFLVLLASILPLTTTRLLRHHVHDPYANWYGMIIGAGIAALIFVPIIAWVNWTHVIHPGEIRSLGFWDAISFQLPERSGLIAEILAVPAAIESAQLWLSARQEVSGWAPIWYSLYSALVVFLVAQASAAILVFVQKTMLKSSQPESGGQIAEKSNTASLAFWGTLLFLASITVGAALVGHNIELQRQVSERGNEAAGETVSATFLEQGIDWTEQMFEAISDTGSETARALEAGISPGLSGVYTPVYAAIPDYADFHYSLVGQYTELTLALQGELNDGLRERIFDGFEQRLGNSLANLDRQFAEEYKNRAYAKIQDATGKEDSEFELGQTVLDDAVNRAAVSFPLAGAASIVGSGGLKALGAGMATKIGTTLATKFGIKTAAKGGAVLAGGGTGVAVCSWGGPLAIACGMGGAVTAWFLADSVIINIDEYLNRDDFEAELRALIDEQRIETEGWITTRLREKGQQLDAEVSKSAEDFSLSDLPQTGHD